jgi:SNF2 family DNA or RNA helicase
VQAVAAIKDLPFAAVFHEQGLGKTKIGVDLALYWLAHDIVDSVLVITKKSLIQNWRDELGVAVCSAL